MNLLTYIPQSGVYIDWDAFENEHSELVTNLRHTPQDTRHHTEGDVWTHTKMVVDALVRLEAWQTLDTRNKHISFLAALLHDIAKPLCTKIQDDGTITSAGHSKKGEIDTRILLWRSGLDFEDREIIARIIGSHQKPFFILNAENPIFELRKLSRDIPLHLLFMVAMADALGRYTTPAQNRQITIDNLELVTILAQEEGILYEPYIPADADTWLKYLNKQGNDIDPAYSVYSNNHDFKVYIMCGLPGMGKDTWIKTYGQNLPVLSYDALREEKGLLHGDAIGDIPSLIKDEAKSYLRKKQSFIWNATHISGSMRKKALDLVHAYGAYVEIIYIEASNEKAWRTQNKNRNASVPDKALDRMLFKWEIPSINEAHDVSYIIGGTRQYPIPESKRTSMYEIN